MKTTGLHIKSGGRGSEEERKEGRKREKRKKEKAKEERKRRMRIL